MSSCSHVSPTNRSSMTGVKSMVMRAGRPGMSGIKVVSRRRIRVPRKIIHQARNIKQIKFFWLKTELLFIIYNFF